MLLVRTRIQSTICIITFAFVDVQSRNIIKEVKGLRDDGS